MAKTIRFHATADLILRPALLALLAVGTPAESAAPVVSPSGAASSVTPAQAARAPRQAVGCLIGPERVADLGAAVAGVVSTIAVDRGDRVRAGQILVQIDNAVEVADVQAARARSDIDADLRAAEANLALARQRHTRMAGLVDEGFVSALAVEQARTERDVAEQKVAQARGQKVVQARELGVASAQLGRRTLRSPFNGVVSERFVNPGERVDDKPLLRVAMLDPLRVELVMPAARWGSVRGGDRIGVLPDLPGASSVLATVSQVDRLIDPASNTFRVRLVLPNPGHKLPAGARCKVDAPTAGEHVSPKSGTAAGL